MHRPPQLIAELIKLTKPWGWTLADLAHELEISDITLTQYRSGRRRLTMTTFSRIAKKFGEQRIIRDLAWQYATTEFGQKKESVEGEEEFHLPPAVLGALRNYVHRFAEEVIHGGRGLYLRSDDSGLLSSAVHCLEKLFAATKVAVCKLRSDHAPTANDVRNGMAAPVLILERTDFLHAEIEKLILKRSAVVKPILVTSMQKIDDVSDAYLRRIFRSMMKLVDFGSNEPATVPVEVTTSEHAAA